MPKVSVERTIGQAKKAVLSGLSIRAHLLDFFNGILATPHVVFYASSVVLWLYLAVKATEASRWR